MAPAHWHTESLQPSPVQAAPAADGHWRYLEAPLGRERFTLAVTNSGSSRLDDDDSTGFCPIDGTGRQQHRTTTAVSNSPAPRPLRPLSQIC